MKRVLLGFVGLMCSGFLFAETTETETSKENTFSLGVQIRPRAEYRNGVLFPRAIGQEATGFINNRARISMGYQRDRLSLGLAAQHVGVWGQDPQIDKNGRFILNEAWAQLDLGSGFYAKLGRQTLAYDDERILGALDWNVAGRFHDALKLAYEDTDNKLHLILAFNQNDERMIGGTYYSPGAQPYKSMQTLWYKYANGSPFDISFLIMNLGLEGGDYETATADNKYMQTFGTNINYTESNWSVGGTFYYQSGKTVTDKTVSAYMWALKAGYKIDSKWNIFIGSDYLSGNKEESEKQNAFDPLYGTHHKFYGAMDYFYASGWAGRNPGLWDNHIGVGIKASSKVAFSLTYHYFSTTTTISDDNGRGLGSEFDLQVDWNVMPDVKLTAGYSTMFGTKSMQLVKGGNPSHWQDWAFLSLNINPKVFISKW